MRYLRFNLIDIGFDESRSIKDARYLTLKDRDVVEFKDYHPGR